MFIATAITNQPWLRRSETDGAVYIALLRSCERKQTGIYKYFIPTGFMCPRKMLNKKFLLCAPSPLNVFDPLFTAETQRSLRLRRENQN